MSQQQPGQAPEQPIPVISVQEAWKRVAEGEEHSAPALIDVREPWEYEGGHASGAVNIPLSQFQQRHTEVPRDREVLFICQVGARSLMAARYMRQQGVARAINVDGGTDDWRRQGLPMQTGR